VEAVLTLRHVEPSDYRPIIAVVDEWSSGAAARTADRMSGRAPARQTGGARLKNAVRPRACRARVWRNDMRYTTAATGRVLVVRLEDGDIVHECIQEAARREGVSRAVVWLVGGADEGSRVVVGPATGRAAVIEPMEHVLDEAHELVGVGTIFPDEQGEPVLHLHAAFGREDHAHAGCVRLGVRTWGIGEAIILELTGSEAVRRPDPDTGFELLEV
jgi:predicted DNA-binding protein with PD1-like motif